ncbi:MULTISPECIES: hypothetical protein [Rhizobium]|nr:MULTISPECIES: hypothetical protein [Rhizobium]MBM7048845.1 hypothetical protein [Rhizobium lusitanum]
MPPRDQVKIATKFGWDVDPDTGIKSGNVNSRPGKSVSIGLRDRAHRS